MTDKSEQKKAPKVLGKRDYKLEALGDYIIVESIERNVTAGGVIVPDSSQTPETEATITSIGPKVEDAEVGDVILFKGGAFTFEFEGDSYLSMREANIVCRIKRNETAH